MPVIVIVLSFLVLFLLAFLIVLLGPVVGVGFTIWRQNKGTAALESSANPARDCR